MKTVFPLGGLAISVPPGWRATTFGEMCDSNGGEIQTGPFGSQLHAYDYEDVGIPVVMPQDLNDGSISTASIARVNAAHVNRLGKHRLSLGDIVYSRRGDVTRFAVVTEPEVGWLCGTGCMRIRPNCKDLDVTYLRWFLGHRAVTDWLVSQAKGATMPNLNTGILRALPLFVPPLPEQRRIASILDKADAVRRKRQQAIRLTETFLRSAFLDMFGDPVANPKDWPLVQFGDLGERRLGKMLDSKRQTGTQARPYLRNTNVQWDHFDLDDLLEMDFNEKDRAEFCLRDGDVLICEGGEVGRAAVWCAELRECYFQKALHRLRPDLQLVVPEYIVNLMWFLARHGGLNDHVTSATIAHLTGVKLKAMKVPLPPIPLQQRYSEIVRSHQRLAQSEAQAEARLRELFDALVARAFRGNLALDGKATAKTTGG